MEQYSFRTKSNETLNGDYLKWAICAAGGAFGLYTAVAQKKAVIPLAVSAVTILLAASKSRSATERHTAKASFLVGCSPGEAYRLWHDPRNISAFMRHIDSVRELEDGLVEWTAVAPFGARVTWIARIVADEENERISWRSTPDSQFQNSGSVTFKEVPGGRGTLISLHISYIFPGGLVGRAVAATFGRDPSHLVRESLRRFKALVEAGEIPTAETQSHGPRSRVVSAAEALRHAADTNQASRAPSPLRSRAATAGGDL